MDVNEDEYNIIKPSFKDNGLAVYVYVLKDLDLKRIKYLMNYKNKSNYTNDSIKLNGKAGDWVFKVQNRNEKKQYCFAFC